MLKVDFMYRIYCPSELSRFANKTVEIKFNLSYNVGDGFIRCEQKNGKGF